MLNSIQIGFGFFCYTANVPTIKILSKKLKEKMSCRQVVGGPHSTLDGELLEKIPTLDYQVKREGEFAMLDLVNEKNPEEISGVSYRDLSGTIHKKGDAFVITPIEQLPFPEKDKLLGISEEEKKYIDVSYVITTRRMSHEVSAIAPVLLTGREIKLNTESQKM